MRVSYISEEVRFRAFVVGSCLTVWQKALVLDPMDVETMTLPATDPRGKFVDPTRNDVNQLVLVARTQHTAIVRIRAIGQQFYVNIAMGDLYHPPSYIAQKLVGLSG